MKTKYIKVPVSERMPEKKQHVKVIDESDNVYEGFITDNAIWQVYTQFDYVRIEYWLEEVPDREQEMMDMLERVVAGFEIDYVLDGEIVDSPYNWLQDRYKEAKELLNSIK